MSDNGNGAVTFGASGFLRGVEFFLVGFLVIVHFLSSTLTV